MLSERERGTLRRRPLDRLLELKWRPYNDEQREGTGLICRKEAPLPAPWLEKESVEGRQEPQGSSPFRTATAGSLQSCLVELCVEPAGLCGRCTGVAVPLRVVPSPTGLPSKRGPHAGQTPSSWKWFLKLAGGCGATALGNDPDLTALRLCTFPQWTPANLPRGCISAEPREAARPVRTSQPLRDPSLLSVYLKMEMGRVGSAGANVS